MFKDTSDPYRKSYINDSIEQSVKLNPLDSSIWIR